MRRLDIGSAKWAAMAALAIAPCALANTIYTYTGNPFTTIVGTPGVPNRYTTSDFIDVMLTLANPLPANLALTALTSGVVSLQMTDGGNGPTVDPLGTVNAIIVSTDATGAISQWNILSISQAAGIPTTVFGTSNDPNATQATGDLATVTNAAGTIVEAGANVDNPGIWSAATQVPEPAGYALAIAGLAALALWRKVQGKAKTRPLG
jgi:hypothetical protein